MESSELESDDTSQDPKPEDFQNITKLILVSGWLALVVSSVFLYLSGLDWGDDKYQTSSAIFLMLARIAGMGGFCVGVFAIFVHRWNTGVSLILLSLILPFLSFHLHGSF